MTLRVFEIITDVKYVSETRHHCCTNLGLKTIRTVMIETNLNDLYPCTLLLTLNTPVGVLLNPLL